MLPCGDRDLLSSALALLSSSLTLYLAVPPLIGGPWLLASPKRVPPQPKVRGSLSAPDIRVWLGDNRAPVVESAWD